MRACDFLSTTIFIGKVIIFPRRFSASINKRNPDHPEYATALELKDELDFDQRTTIVLRVLQECFVYLSVHPSNA
jgi:hypothetical protein